MKDRNISAIETSKYAIELKYCINGNRFFSLAHAIGKSLNSRKDRFDKSDLMEQAIEEYSNGRLKWVDEISRDHIDIQKNLSIEFKYSANSIFSEKKKHPRSYVSVKIKNSLGRFKGTHIENPANYYIVAQQDAMSIISWEDIKQYLLSTSDGIKAKIPFKKLNIIFYPGESNIKNLTLNYREEKAQLQKKIIKSI